jgi:tight adherence protein C
MSVHPGSWPPLACAALAASAVVAAARTVPRAHRRRARPSTATGATDPTRAATALGATDLVGPRAARGGWSTVGPGSWALASAVTLAAVWSLGLATVVAATALGLGARAVRRRRAAMAEAQARQRALPDLVDLFALCGAAGHPVATALVTVGPRAPPPLRDHVAEAVRRFERGLPLADALVGLGRALGPDGEALADALAHAAASGTPLGPALADVAAAARDRRRRAAQEAAHRLPVKLLFPLVLCILPAAVLLAVVPVLAASVASLAP